MGAATRRRQRLQATLCEIERGVFHATYPDALSVSDVGELPAYQTGASAADAKRAIELHAHALGYDAIVWTETFIAPLFASGAKSVLHEPASTYVAYRGP
jgi:hypothetical protein